MLEKLPEDFKKFFLLEFTRQLIENSTDKYLYELEHLIKDKEKGDKKELIEKFKNAQKKIREKKIENQEEEKEIEKEVKEKIKKEENIEKKFQSYPKLRKRIKREKKKRILRVPETRLPPHLQYLKPEPRGEVDLDLGRLNPLLEDPMVQEIQCDGPDENVLVKGIFGIKPTKIILKNDEVEEIIEEFSDKSKIPAEPGLFKVVMGSIIFTAIISETTSSRFILTKMNYNPRFRN